MVPRRNTESGEHPVFRQNILLFDILQRCAVEFRRGGGDAACDHFQRGLRRGLRRPLDVRLFLPGEV